LFGKFTPKILKCLIMPSKKLSSCTCPKCVACCWHVPGWFGSMKEVKEAAKLKGMGLREFAHEYLIAEWWSEEDGVLVPSPRKNFKRMTKDRREAKKLIKSDLSECSQDLFSKEEEQNGKGFVKATWGHNLMKGYACVFLDENQRCSIQKNKPKECRLTMACQPIGVERSRRRIIARYWKKHQDFVQEHLV